MSQLVHQRCLNHSTREAVARCPECRQFFCRECVTEHDDRVLCAVCLKKLARPRLAERLQLAGLWRLGQGALGVLLAWLFFYWTGQALLSGSSDFHEGTVWKTGFWDE